MSDDSERRSEEARERLRDVTRDVILQMRAQYLAGGGNALTHWDHIAARVKAAIQMRSTAATWGTEMMRTLRLGSPSRSLSSALVALKNEVDEAGRSREWRSVMLSEHSLVMAEARLEAEARRDAREAT